jgi:hypothetical protein
MKGGIVALVLIVAAMLVGTKLYTDSRYESSQLALESEVAFCASLRRSGAAMTPEQAARCDRPWSRNSSRNSADETIAMVLYGATGLVALIGIVMLLRRRRRGQAAVAGDAG